jgi:hypothetical protein
VTAVPYLEAEVTYDRVTTTVWKPMVVSLKTTAPEPPVIGVLNVISRLIDSLRRFAGLKIAE